MPSDLETRRAHQAVSEYLRESHPDAQWDAISEIHTLLCLDLYYGPMAAREEADDYVGFPTGCKALSTLIEDLPSELFYDLDSGCVMESDPWQDESNWEEGVSEYEQGEYIGPTEVMTVITIEALFDKELWRYLT